MSPDWSPTPQAIPYADISDPQTLNLYGYVRNNPLGRADADGHCCSEEWQFFKSEVKGVWNATGGGLVSLGKSLASGQAGLNVGDTAILAATNPGAIVEAGKEFGSQMAATATAAAHGDPEAIGEVVATVAMTVAPFAKGAPASGGRLGSAATRAQNAQIADSLESRGFEITGGGGKLPEEYIPGPGGGRAGSNYVDVTAVRNGKTVRVQTIDTLKDGVTPTSREAKNAARIRSTQQPGDHTVLIPKKEP
jgi:hypothetical protein